MNPFVIYRGFANLNPIEGRTPECVIFANFNRANNATSA
jgi:hypothetical protein